jgi:probable phosphoglycerate mutase
MPKIRLFVVRHGQTYFNKYKRFQGWSDIDLTQSGIDDGMQAGQRLANISFQNAFSSDLSRAKRTAELILSKNTQGSPKEPILLNDFREEFFGSFEGINGQETIKQLDPSINEDRGYDIFIKKNGIDKSMDIFQEKDPEHDAENAEQFWQRINAGFEKILPKMQADSDNLLVVHGTVQRAFADRWGQKEWSFEPVHNGGVSILEIDLTSHETVMTLWNDNKTVF